MFWWILFGAGVAYMLTKNNTVVTGDPLTQWAQAIQDHEGWFPGSVSYRNNNPGNLRGNIGGSIGNDSRGFAIFPNYDTGFNALLNDLRAKVSKYPDYSILQIMTRYLGGNVLNPQVTTEGDPFAYARAVASKLGVSINDTLSNVFGGRSNG